jgi:hypothetical protein
MSHKADMKPLQGSGQLSHDYNFLDAEDSVSEWQSFVAVFKDKRRFSQQGKLWNQSWCPSLTSKKRLLSSSRCSREPVKAQEF